MFPIFESKEFNILKSKNMLLKSKKLHIVIFFFMIILLTACRASNCGCP